MQTVEPMSYVAGGRFGGGVFRFLLGEDALEVRRGDGKPLLIALASVAKVRMTRGWVESCCELTNRKGVKTLISSRPPMATRQNVRPQAIEYAKLMRALHARLAPLAPNVRCGSGSTVSFVAGIVAVALGALIFMAVLSVSPPQLGVLTSGLL